MMKRVRVSIFLMLSLCVISVYAAQDLPQDITHGRQVMIDNAVTDFSYLTQGFDFLQTQGLLDTSFHDFLEQHVSHEDEDMNFDQVIIKAEDILTLHMKHTFIKALDMTFKYYYSDDPVFLYVMQHKDDKMRDMVHLWLYEWCNTQNEYKDFQLHTAVYNKEILKMLIDAGIELNIQDQLGRTPLHSVICNGDTKLVAVLVAAGVDLNIQDGLGRTPLHNANIGQVGMLIAAGADVNIQDCVGYTPLHRAARCNYKEIVKMLLAASACINHQDEDGQTPLHLAVSNDNTNIALMLIHAGADTYIFNKHGKTVDQLHGCTKIIIKSIVQNREKKQKKIDAQAIARLKKIKSKMF